MELEGGALRDYLAAVPPSLSLNPEIKQVQAIMRSVILVDQLYPREPGVLEVKAAVLHHAAGLGGGTLPTFAWLMRLAKFGGGGGYETPPKVEDFKILFAELKGCEKLSGGIQEVLICACRAAAEARSMEGDAWYALYAVLEREVPGLLAKLGWHPVNSTFKGVSWNNHVKKWRSHIRIDGKLTFLGSFTNEKEAARKYDEKAATLSRPLNFPKAEGEASAVLRRGKRKFKSR